MVAYPEVSPARAALAIAVSVLRFWRLLFAGRIRQPIGHIGGQLTFADGSCARVFRETRLERPRVADPALLVVEFRPRLIHGRAHRVFERLSVLNTPLFVGFPGFASKLWMAHDENEVYRGIYEWDGAERARAYAQALSWILTVVSVPGSVSYHVVPGKTRSEYVAEPEELVEEASPVNLDAWWRVS